MITVKLANWHFSFGGSHPVLRGTLTYQALPLFRSHTRRFALLSSEQRCSRFGYSRSGIKPPSSRCTEAPSIVPRNIGQVSEIEVDDGAEYYHNVTRVVPCIDESRSEKYPEESIAKAIFDESKLPDEPVIFIDPLMRGPIYVNDSAKAEMECLIQQANITGMAFEQVGGH